MNGLDIFNVYVMGSIEMLTVFHFYNRFLQKKAGMLSYFLFVFLGMAVMLFSPANGGINLLLYVLLLVAEGFYRSRTRSVLIILYAIVAVAIMHLCYGISHSFSYILASFVLPKNPQISGFVLMVMSSLAALLMSVLCYLVIDKKFSCEKTMGTKYGLLLLIPSLLVGGVGEYIDFNSYGDTIVTGMDGKLTDANPLPVLTIQLFGIASLFCMMFVYKRLVETFERNKELSLLELEKHSLKQYVEEAKIRYERTKAFRHDVKNHLVIVRELVENGNTQEALQYMQGMENLTADMSFPVSTNNPVLDILIGNKLGMAQDSKIEVKCSLMVPYPCEIADIDFCIIFSNALDNAITACRQIPLTKRRYIQITGNVQGDFLFLAIRNSYRGEKSIRKGTGLANINAVAEKYQGTMEIRAEENVFEISILLIIPQHAESISEQTYLK